MKVQEYCINCDTEVEVNVKQGTRYATCPKCKHSLLLCSLCNNDKQDCRECPYARDARSEQDSKRKAYLKSIKK